jgi:hypothetical protein
MTSEEDVYKLLSLEYGRLTYLDNRLIIMDKDLKHIKMSIYLPKMSPDPKSKKDDGVKSFTIGESKSEIKHILRLRYYTGNWIFIYLKGKKAKKRSEFLIKEYKQIKKTPMESFGINMGKKSKYLELKEQLVENYEKMRLDYIKPRVFGLEKLPYRKYYTWLKYERNIRKHRFQKEVVIKRKKSRDYFDTNIDFDEFIFDLGYDPSANFTIVDNNLENQMANAYNPQYSYVSLLGPDLSGTKTLITMEKFDDKSEDPSIEKKIKESLDVFDIYDPSNPSQKSINLEGLNNLLTKPRNNNNLRSKICLN